jgi:predicted nucleotidyltransferase
MPNQPGQSPAVLAAARDFAQRVAARWPMRGAMLFGSQARGSANPESDTDIAIMLGILRKD